MQPDPAAASQPMPSDTDADGNLATAVIRQKLSRIYGHEPDAQIEVSEAEHVPHRSKHQEFMYQLHQSGKPMEDIQSAWHSYYAQLPEHEKHEVWREFYAANASVQQPQSQPEPIHHSAQVPAATRLPRQPYHPKARPSRTPANIHDSILKAVSTPSRGRKPTARQHLQSLMFGLGMGAITIVIMLFSFFNDRLIAPFMTPSRAITDASIIIDPTNTKVGDTPQIIIPKINVQIPVVYDVDTIEEPAVETGLERGVVHYATTPNPGETGNGVIFGHSANNILNKGQYKFAFVLLHKLDIGDTFYIDYHGTRYAYQVFDRKIVPPTDVSVLNPTAKPSTFTIITCDPPGTALKRLVVVGEQISPDPTGNIASSVNQTASPKPSQLPSNAPSLWYRITHLF